MRTPQELQQRDCLLFPMASYNTQWHFRNAKGAVIDAPVHGRCTISNALALKQCAVADMGVTLLPQWVVGEKLRAGSLVDLFPQHHQVTPTDFETAAWLPYPLRHYLPLKVRVFVDFLKQKFQDAPPWKVSAQRRRMPTKK